MRIPDERLNPGPCLLVCLAVRSLHMGAQSLTCWFMHSWFIYSYGAWIVVILSCFLHAYATHGLTWCNCSSTFALVSCLHWFNVVVKHRYPGLDGKLVLIATWCMFCLTFALVSCCHWFKVVVVRHRHSWLQCLMRIFTSGLWVMFTHARFPCWINSTSSCWMTWLCCFVCVRILTWWCMFEPFYFDALVFS